ncbi:hypothetical protein CBR_g34702 [Chara braunii]|uniref:HMG box domain-containing protein n=1 Tax=Chara braunii TaxID=69332 RepID=A0A388JZ71_CHABU|nr:hypothetical protein CBR_g34702 [Chara braunii]|eukprot:GBG63003.1 hypothetical protein CBR_g34702 [Chara braunii]
MQVSIERHDFPEEVGDRQYVLVDVAVGSSVGTHQRGKVRDASSEYLICLEMASMANRGDKENAPEVAGVDMASEAGTAAPRAGKGRGRKQKEKNASAPVSKLVDKPVEKAPPPPTPGKLALQQRNQHLESEVVTLTAQLEKVLLEKEEARSMLEASKQMRKKQTKNTAMAFEPRLDVEIPVQPTAGGGEKAKKAEKKDPRKPKQPLTAFMLWAKDNRQKMKDANPNLGFVDFSKLVGEAWKAVPEAERKPYEVAAVSESERYKVEKEAYDKIIQKEKQEEEALRVYREQQRQEMAMQLMSQYEEHQASLQGAKDGKHKRSERDPEKPKQPPSAFFLYANERRPQLQEEGKSYGIGEIGKLLGQEWKEMQRKMKQVYEDRAKELRDKYNKDMELYKERKQKEEELARSEEMQRAEEQRREAIRMYETKRKEQLREKSALELLKKTEQEAAEAKKRERAEAAAVKKAAKDPNKPKRPQTAFLLFSSEVRKQVQESNPGATFVEVSKLTASLWKNLDEATKKEYESRVAPLWKEYAEDMKAYSASSAPSS